MTSEFSDNVAVITGGGGILCSTMARAPEGARIAVPDLKAEKAGKAPAKITVLGRTAIDAAVSLPDAESLNAAHKKVCAASGPFFSSAGRWQSSEKHHH
jgi:hypothetical protein